MVLNTILGGISTTTIKCVIPVPFTLNSKPTPGGRRIGGSSVPRDWANNPVSTVGTQKPDMEGGLIIQCERYKPTPGGFEFK